MALNPEDLPAEARAQIEAEAAQHLAATADLRAALATRVAELREEVAAARADPTNPLRAPAAVDEATQLRRNLAAAEARYADAQARIDQLVAENEALERRVDSTRAVAERHLLAEVDAERRVDELRPKILAALDLDDLDDDGTPPADLVEAVIADLGRANQRGDAIRQMANDANATLRAKLLAALGVEDDGRTPLGDYVDTLVADRDAARAAVATPKLAAPSYPSYRAFLGERPCDNPTCECHGPATAPAPVQES